MGSLRNGVPTVTEIQSAKKGFLSLREKILMGVS